MKKDYKQSIRATLNTTKYMMGFVVRDGKGKIYIMFNLFLTALNAAMSVVYTVFPGLIITELTNEKSLFKIALWVGILVSSPLISVTLNALLNTYMSRISMYLRIKLETSFYRHLALMDYETLENPDIQTMKERAAETLGGALSITNLFMGLIGNVISLLAISTIVTSLNPIILVLIIITIYINSLITKWLNKKQFVYNQEISKQDRKLWGFSYMLENFHFAKELRLFNINDFLMNKVIRNYKETDDIKIELLKKQNKAGILSSIIQAVEKAALYAYLIWLVIKKGLGIGHMTIYLNASSQFSSGLSSVVGSYLQLSAQSLNVQELIEFLNIPMRQLDSGKLHPIFDNNSTIVFKDVSFKYPGSSNYALEHLNITINCGKTLCIVGENGSGKSTFIKLLTRLYFPTEGEILLNGININEYDYLEYQRLFSPVFQDFCQFFLTLGENITLSTSATLEKLNDVCSQSGLIKLANKLPKGYDTQVDKWIDEEGFQPSGGEGQRIAIARALYHGGEIFILDEPTAALDPNAEYEIYTQFNRMIENKCAILITHRLSAVQLSDTVAVFDKGHVAEYGTHKELYAKNGIYTEMFNKQSQFYRDEQS